MIIKVTVEKTETYVYDTNNVIQEAKDWDWYEDVENLKTKADWIEWFENQDTCELPQADIVETDYSIKAE